ncbi:hypothetical protein G4B11_009392 [Aspergillus flavus]|nr:hypothetical protein G4B11_009392 [Aspergillus flavus]
MSTFRQFNRFLPPKVFAFCKYTIIAGLTGATSWQLWSRHCYFEPFGPDNDPLFQSKYFRRFNPNKHPSLDDSCVREVPLSRIKPGLVKDALNGGSKLLEMFCGGVWGGYGYAIQRKILTLLCKDRANESMLWSKEQLLSSSYDEGTIVTDHFIVLEKTPRSIVMRGGSSPTEDPDKPHEMDNISEITVDIDTKKGVAEFRLKNIFFNGVRHTSEALFPPPVLGGEPIQKSEVDNFAESELPDGNSADQIWNFAQYMHVVMSFRAERVVQDITEEGQDGGYGVEEDNPGFEDIVLSEELLNRDIWSTASYQKHSPSTTGNTV